MQKRSKPHHASRDWPLPPDGDGRLLGLVEEILALVNRHQPEPDEGVQALLVAFLQAASQALDISTAESLDGNRTTLLMMLEQARSVLAERPYSPGTCTVH